MVGKIYTTTYLTYVEVYWYADFNAPSKHISVRMPCSFQPKMDWIKLIQLQCFVAHLDPQDFWRCILFEKKSYIEASDVRYENSRSDFSTSFLSPSLSHFILSGSLCLCVTPHHHSAVVTHYAKDPVIPFRAWHIRSMRLK